MTIPCTTARSARPIPHQDITRIDDTRIAAVRPLISPALLQDELPVSDEIQTLVERSRTEIADVLHGRDDRLIIVVGPCSIHDHGQAMQYARLLRAAADQHRQDLLIVMRVYFEKPAPPWAGRATSMTRAWTAASASTKACAARELLLDVSGLGLPIATEFLDLLSPQYIADLIAWGAIGARTTESPSHRQLSSA